MNKKRIVTATLALALTFSSIGCSKKTVVEKKSARIPNTNQRVVEYDSYTNYYTTGYDRYLRGLEKDSIYVMPGDINTIYKNKEYPGNEKYLEDVKSAYKNRKEKIEAFVDSLKKNDKFDNNDMKKMNKDLISTGEKQIKNIDEKINRLNAISKEDISKSKEDFSKVVTEATTLKDRTQNDFDRMIRDMNTRFGINK